MNRTRSIALCSTVFLAVLAVLLLPGAASAAPAYNAIVVDSPVQPTFSIPGLFSLIFGESGGPTQLEIPGLNATATVDGLTLGPTLGWNAITLSQKEPAVSEAGTISGPRSTSVDRSRVIAALPPRRSSCILALDSRRKELSESSTMA